MDYRESIQEIFNLYEAGQYRQALDIARTTHDRFPERDDRLTFMEACLLSVGGDPEGAIKTLKLGLERGLFFHEQALADPDLDNARSLGEWSPLVAKSMDALASAEIHRPAPFERRVKGAVGSFVALHGAGAVPIEEAAWWDQAVPREWDLIVPAGTLPTSNGRWAWPFDLDPGRTSSEVAALATTSPFVLGGFSQGGALAAKLVLESHVKVEGLVLVAASPRNLADPLPPGDTPIYLLEGAEDRMHARTAALAESLRLLGYPVNLDIRQGLGHEFPGDFGETVSAALEWIKGS